MSSRQMKPLHWWISSWLWQVLWTFRQLNQVITVIIYTLTIYNIIVNEFTSYSIVFSEQLLAVSMSKPWTSWAASWAMLSASQWIHWSLGIAWPSCIMLMFEYVQIWTSLWKTSWSRYLKMHLYIFWVTWLLLYTIITCQNIHVIGFCLTHVKYKIILNRNLFYLLGQWNGSQSISAHSLASCFRATCQHCRHWYVIKANTILCYMFNVKFM